MLASFVPTRKREGEGPKGHCIPLAFGILKLRCSGRDIKEFFCIHRRTNCSEFFIWAYVWLFGLGDCEKGFRGRGGLVQDFGDENRNVEGFLKIKLGKNTNKI